MDWVVVGGEGLLFLQEVGKKWVEACCYFLCFYTVCAFFPHPFLFLIFLPSTSSSIHFHIEVSGLPTSDQEVPGLDPTWKRNSAHNCTALYCTKPFIISI